MIVICTCLLYAHVCYIYMYVSMYLTVNSMNSHKVNTLIMSPVKTIEHVLKKPICKSKNTTLLYFALSDRLFPLLPLVFNFVTI